MAMLRKSEELAVEMGRFVNVESIVVPDNVFAFSVDLLAGSKKG